MHKTQDTTDEHGQTRDRRGEWRSGRPVGEEPLLIWPPQPKKLLKWMFGWPGYLWPWHSIYILITVFSYLYLTPSFETMQNLEPGWISAILLRNLVLLTIVAGSLHLWLYRWKKQGRRFKYNGNWMDKKQSFFLFSSQVHDNMFWSLVSGVPIWTAYEVLMWWAYANNWLPYIDPATNPVWFVLWILLMPLWRVFHFYWIHRLIHWKPLFTRVHYIHHKNINIGPWSGMSMHPVEHLIFFSRMLIHIVVPSHPFHMMLNGMETGLAPAQGHSGFDEIVWGDDVAWKNEQIMHYMHHRYYTVNYGESLVPLDKWFGSFHDGTAEADAEFMRARRTNNKA